MVLPLIALGLAAGGAGASAYGAHQKKRAMRKALADYQGRLGALGAEEAAGDEATQGAYGALQAERFGDMRGTLDKFFAAGTPQTTPADSATAQAALARVGGQSLPTGGAQGGWAQASRERNAPMLQGLIDTAADAGAARRSALGTRRALSDFNTQDTLLSRRGQDTAGLDQLRRALLQRRLARLQNEAQIDFGNAGRAGDDWMMAGSLMGMGGSLMGSASTSKPPAGASPAWDQSYGDPANGVDYGYRPNPNLG